MATLKQVRKRISSVKSTMQITKAMKMVAAAKLRRAQDNIIAARPYADKMREMVVNIATRAGEDVEHPLLKTREVKKTRVLAFTGDRGLCGAFNTNLIKTSVSALADLKAEGKEIAITAVGRKGNDFLRKRNYSVDKTYINLGSENDLNVAIAMAKEVAEAYTKEEVDEVILVYSEFHSAVVQRPKIQTLLPLATGVGKEDEPNELQREYIFEPSAKKLLEDLLPKFVEIQVYKAILDNLASEFGARMTAMENATSNAKDMIDALTLQYNRARQEAITKELMDIVGGAEALVK